MIITHNVSGGPNILTHCIVSLCLSIYGLHGRPPEARNRKPTKPFYPNMLMIQYAMQLHVHRHIAYEYIYIYMKLVAD